MGYKKKQYLLLGIAAVAAVTAAVVLVSGFSWPEPGPPPIYRKIPASMMDISGLSRALFMYGTEFDGKLPASLSILAGPDGDYIEDPYFLVSALTGHEPPRWDDQKKQWVGAIDYVYLYPSEAPGLEHLTSDTLLLYLPPKYTYEDVVLCGFGDGHVEQIEDMEHFGRLLQEAKQRGAEIPQEDQKYLPADGEAEPVF